MQAPLIVFDHVRKTVTAIQIGRGGEKRLQEILASPKQVGTSGRPAN